MSRRSLFAAFLLLLAAASSLDAHDLFLRLDSFFLAPNSAVRVRVVNGTFTKSENAVLHARIADLAVVSPAGRVRPDSSAWSDRGSASTLRFRTGEPGTYVVGASVRPNGITLAAKDFNEYLASDGIPDILARRRERGELELPARERYSKHVKALLQVGPTRSSSFGEPLGYAAELVPMDNPYALLGVRWMRVVALVDGAPVPNQLVLAGGRTPKGGRLAVQSIRTDSDGIARVNISRRGQWYVKFIHMAPVTGDSAFDYESKWATLTFEVR